MLEDQKLLLLLLQKCSLSLRNITRADLEKNKHLKWDPKPTEVHKSIWKYFTCGPNLH